MKLPVREAVPLEETWDLTRLVKDEDEFNERVEVLLEAVHQFQVNYEGHLNAATSIAQALKDYEKIFEQFVIVHTYANLSWETNQGDEAAQARVSRMNQVAATLFSKTSFFKTTLLSTSEDVLNEAVEQAPHLKHFVEDILRKQPYQLHPEVEKAFASLNVAFDTPYALYNATKALDLRFPDVDVDGEQFPLSYSSFENNWEQEVDFSKRHAAFQTFYGKLRDYEATTAKAYDTQVQIEKRMADLRGFDSVFHSLLHEQKVTEDLYHRQIDVIMNELAPHMRRYAKLLQKVHGLDQMTFADLKISLDPEYEPTVTKKEAEKMILEALQPMGENYTQMLQRAYDERWIDYAPNEGKRTGAFCASPYGANSYILMSWNNHMSNVFTLAHELGHAGHFQQAYQKQNVFDGRVSRYFVEAPSTLNELLVAEHLVTTKEDLRFKRWIISNMVSKTYYHNFVTHLLEAAYQREVYRIVDAGGAVTAKRLNELKRQVLEQFWGEDIVINEGAERTWMRQPHYYMGLYPYTYSAGLTIATQVAQRIIHKDENAVDDWLRVLQAGGTATPEELAKMAGVDVSTDEPLRNTIAYIGQLITQLEELTEELEKA